MKRLRVPGGWIGGVGVIGLFLPALLLLLAQGCGLGGNRPDRIVLFVSGDSQGYLEPCGCRTDQAGGLPGRATVIKQGSKDTPARLVVDVGNMTTGGRPYELLKLRYLTEGMAKIGYDAVNLGRKEAGLDLDTLKGALATTPLPFVSANVLNRQTGKPIVEPFRLISRGGLTIGITGVTAIPSEEVGPGILVRPPLEALTEVIPTLKRRCDYLIVLAFVGEDTLRDIANKFHEVDALLGGDVPQSSGAIQQINRAVVFNVTDHGKILGKLMLQNRGKSYEATQAEGIKIVGDRLEKDQDMVTLIARYKDELRQRRYEMASAEGMERIVGQESTADEFVGEKQCISCHQEAHKATEHSGHQHAFQTLVEKKSEFDPECLSCHTVGYGRHSGFIDQEKTPDLANVQCESCHGRGKEHVRQMQGKAPRSGERSTLRPVTQATCIACHDEENSANFRYSAFWPKIAH